MSSTDLERYEPAIDAVVDHATGQVLALREAPADDLAAWLDHVRDAERALREQKAAVSMELHRRMDDQVAWKLSGEHYTITGQPPSRVTYDAEALHDALSQLVADDVIPPRALADAITVKTEYSVKVAGVNRLKSLGGAARAAVERCAHPVDPLRRRITLARRDGRL